jgi:shikimate kinase
MSNRSIFLIGFMAAGKTTVGQALAARLGREFIDLDAMIVAQAGRSITEIFAQDGEAFFRALESNTLQSLATRAGAVIALGGGAFISATNRELVRAQGISILLDCELSEILKRLGNDRSRPLFQDPAQMATLLESRLPIYREADLHIDVTTCKVDQIVTEIIDKLDLSTRHI